MDDFVGSPFLGNSQPWVSTLSINEAKFGQTPGGRISYIQTISSSTASSTCGAYVAETKRGRVAGGDVYALSFRMIPLGNFVWRPCRERPKPGMNGFGETIPKQPNFVQVSDCQWMILIYPLGEPQTDESFMIEHVLFLDCMILSLYGREFVVPKLLHHIPCNGCVWK